MKASQRRRFSRLEALGLMGLAGGAWAGCAGGSVSSLPSTASPSVAAAAAATASAAAASSACAGTPEGEIGPYFADDSAPGFNRSTILANIDGSGVQTGIPLTLTVKVIDTQASCAAVAGAQVDIWHCNASGVYSDEGVESTAGLTWLRGYQATDANGSVTFTTIVPGWYQGRTTHIHLRVRSKYSQASSTSDGTNTTQVFFPQAVVNAINTGVAPYSSHGTNPTTNASDHVYTGETKGQTELALSGTSAGGYTATFTVGLPI